MLFCITACKSEQQNENHSDYIPNIDDFDNVTTVTSTNAASAQSAEDLYNGSDYVVVATPEEAFEDAEQIWFDKNKEPTEKFSEVDEVYSFTKRIMKIQKVYKGDDLKIKELTVCQHILTNNEQTKTLFENEYPLVEGEKYLLFLNKGNGDEILYFPMPKQGIYSLDSDKNTSNLEKQVKEMFKEEFKDK